MIRPGSRWYRINDLPPAQTYLVSWVSVHRNFVAYIVGDTGQKGSVSIGYWNENFEEKS